MSDKNSDFIMLPTVDLCFKELMNNPKVRKGFIAALLKIPPHKIQKTTLRPTALRREYGDQKLGILDVSVLLEDGTRIDLEMQVLSFAHWDARALFYLGKLFTEQLQAGDSYAQLKKCIHVSILNFIHIPQDQEYFHSICLCDRKTGKEYTDLFELLILELKKLPAKKEGEDPLLQWLRFLGAKNREELKSMTHDNEYLAEAFTELDKLSSDEQKRLEYEARQKALRDYNSLMEDAETRGLEKGMEKGMKKGLEQGMTKGVSMGQQAALKRIMEHNLSRGRSLQEIADFLGMDLQSVIRLSQEEENQPIPPKP